MKIVSKQLITTAIWTDGTYSETVKKTVSIEDETSSMDIEEMHNVVFGALQSALVKGIDKQKAIC